MIIKRGMHVYYNVNLYVEHKYTTTAYLFFLWMRHIFGVLNLHTHIKVHPDNESKVILGKKTSKAFQPKYSSIDSNIPFQLQKRTSFSSNKY